MCSVGDPWQPEPATTPPPPIDAGPIGPEPPPPDDAEKPRAMRKPETAKQSAGDGSKAGSTESTGPSESEKMLDEMNAACRATFEMLIPGLDEVSRERLCREHRTTPTRCRVSGCDWTGFGYADHWKREHFDNG